MGQWDSSLGAMLLGFIFATLLFGVTCTQGAIYIRRFPNDPQYLRKTIYVLLLLDAIHFSFGLDLIYWDFVTNYANPASLLIQRWSFNGVLITGTLSDFTVRNFFTWRAWFLSRKNKYLVSSLVALNTVTLAVGLVTAGISSSFTSLSEFNDEPRWRRLSSVSLGLGALTDTTIALVLSYLLFQGRRMASRSTESVVNTLLLYAISTGVLTAANSVFCLAAGEIWPNSSISAASYFPLSKVYLNAMLASLNARGTFKFGSTAVMSTTAESKPRVTLDTLPSIGAFQIHEHSYPGSVTYTSEC